ncbi:hypothetical protein C8R47DRAFT_406650 [Mycena vitilis]|nr:hypothetical protein C8R47DRAFT_406650 [Mycena vitilis]
MSVTELRLRVAELSTTIDKQKKLLRKLEKDKSLVLRQINAVLDPVARLPFELSSDIFLRSLPVYPKPGASNLPVVFLHVCNAWADIALSTPALWDKIQINLPPPVGLKGALQSWFQGALRGRFDDQGIATIVWQHGQHVKHLDICDGGDDNSDSTSMDPTGGAKPGPLPVLRTFKIRRGDSGRGVEGNQILELMRLAPNLSDCILDSMAPVYDVISGTEKVLLPSLRRLMFGEYEQKPESDDDIFDHLTLPALETLSLAMRDVSGDDLISFLLRSSPPLLELVVGSGSYAEFIELDECFRLIPALTSFELWWPGADLTAALFTALTDSPSLVPNLQRLLIHPHDMSDSYWRTFLRVLSARRNELKIVNVQVKFGPPEIAEDVRNALRALVVDGMQIDIGIAGVMFSLISR